MTVRAKVRGRTRDSTLHGRSGRAGCLALLSVLCGCSWLIEADRDQCERDSDCTRAGLPGACVRGVCVASSSASECTGADCADSGRPSPAGDAGACGTNAAGCDTGEICFKDECATAALVERFACEEPPPPEGSGTVPFRMHVQEFVSQAPLADMTVAACRANDVSCDAPVATFEDDDGTGDIDLELPFGFSGFLEVRSSDALTALWYFTKPLYEPRVAKDLLVPAPSTVEILASVTQLAREASKGLVILEAFDCAGVASGGVHFEESKHAAIPFFIVNEVPNSEANVTVRDEMNDIAIGGFFNATPGFTLFTARLGVDGPKIGEFNANVRANTVTYLDIHP